MADAPEQITCVDCGEAAHLLDVRGAEGGERIAVYRCSGCLDRWDVVVEPDEEGGAPPAVGPGAPPAEGETAAPGGGG